MATAKPTKKTIQRLIDTAKRAPITIKPTKKIQSFTFSKYHRSIVGINKNTSLETGERWVNQVEVDVYDILKAFGVECPARQHAIKKLLAAGGRGPKETVQDLEEARQSVVRAQEMLQDYGDTQIL
jgi:hypothetical protein